MAKSRISRSSISLAGDGSSIPKFARVFRRWSSSGQNTPNSKSSTTITTENASEEPDSTASHYKSLTVELGHLTTARSCLDVSMQKPISSNASFSKSTSQLEKVGKMKAKEPTRNARNRKLESQKTLSISSPTMSSNLSIAGDEGDVLTPHANRRRNDKFHKIFKTVPDEEKILNFFSCALVGDILLQGHLYISDNFFGFYSNILGHITKILIPVKKVTEIRKVKTAKFIPNAVKVVADTKKFTFTSLISRDTTLRLMVKVWRNSRPQDFVLKNDSECDENTSPEMEGEIDSLGSRASSCASSVAADEGLDASQQSVKSEELPDSARDSNVVEPLTSFSSGSKPSTLTHVYNGIGILGMAFPVQKVLSKLRTTVINLSNLPRTSLFLAMSTILLIFLYMSAAFLIYRVSTLHRRHDINFPSNFNDRDQNFRDVYRWNSHLHSESIGNLQDVLGLQIKQLAEVRKSLQTLKTLTSDSNATMDEESDTRQSSTT